MLPLLYGIGARDYLEPRGFLLETCPTCGTTGIFTVAQLKRKVTFYMVPTVSVRDQLVVECRTCAARFAVPPDRREEFNGRIMTQAQLAARVGAARAQLAVTTRANTQPTFYQVLQVDPAADPEVIEAAFRRLSLKYHPDRSSAPDAADRMRELLAARAVLTDPGKRRAYDASLGIPPRPRPPTPPDRSRALRPEDV